MVGRRVRRLLGRAAEDPTRTPVELRVHLPTLWPDGPDGPLDPAGLRLLAEEYGRSGRRVDDLLTDLELLCDVVGIGLSSTMLETSSVAWSEAFLGATAGADPLPGSAPVDADLDAVERRLVAYGRAPAWGSEATAGTLVTVTGPAGSGAPSWLPMVARQIRTVLPDAVTAEQPEHVRVIAAVAAHPDLDQRLDTLRSRCREFAADLDVRRTPVPTDRASLDRALRRAG